VRLRHIAVGNLRRRKGKAILMIAGLTVAVAAFVLVVSLILSLRAAVDDKLSKYGSNMVVAPSSPQLTLSYGGLNTFGAGTGRVRLLRDADLAALRAVPSASRIAAAVPVLLQPVKVDGRSIVAMGTDIPQALRVKLWWRIEGRAPSRPNELLVGLNVRNELGVQVGDRVSVQGRRMLVSGVLWETGGEEDNVVLMDRAVLGRLTGQVGRMNLIEVTATDVRSVDALSREIETRLPGTSVSSVKKSIQFTTQANTSLEKFGLSVTALIVTISGLVVAITMLASVKERQKEIGVLRAVGYKQRHISRLIFIETAMISSIAAGLGVAAGLVTAGVAPFVVRGLALHLVIAPAVIAAGVVISFLVGLAAALYPAKRAADLDPATALKQL
jgi:putative ABC transport system permease protein